MVKGDYDKNGPVFLMGATVTLLTILVIGGMFISLAEKRGRGR